MNIWSQLKSPWMRGVAVTNPVISWRLVARLMGHRRGGWGEESP